MRNLRRLLSSTWPHNQRGKLTAEYTQSLIPFQKFPETRQQVATFIHSPEPSPEHSHLLLSSECSSRSTQDHLAEEVLSVAMILYYTIHGNGNNKVGHLDPNSFPDWEPRFKHMSAVTASLPAGHRWHCWCMSTFLRQLCHWGARHPGFGVSGTTI